MRKNLLLASLIVGASLSALPVAKKQTPQPPAAPAAPVCCEPAWPDHGIGDCYPAGYNAMAGTELLCAWDVFGTASFIYWHVSQDYMDVGRSALFGLAGSTPAEKASTEYPDFAYKPGFKVGLGMSSSYDGWYAYTQYTWLHQQTSHSSNGLPSAVAVGDSIWIPNDWFNTLGSTAQPQAASLHTHWKMHLDMLDLGMSRPFYEGQYFTVHPKAALRALWIRQRYTINAYNAEDLTAAPAVSTNASQCWSIGPCIGSDAHWLIGRGFRIKGALNFGLLYTQYTKLTHEEFDDTFAGAAAAPINGSLAKYDCLRSMTELGAGFGWGTYLNNQRYHMSFSAQYDFALFWDQNMMRYTAAAMDEFTGYPDPSGDLHMHGLTIDGRFDF